MKAIVLSAMACALCAALPSYAGDVCVVKSGTATAALAELYTSEGRSNCPTFVRDQRNGGMLQALGTESCSQTRGL